MSSSLVTILWIGPQDTSKMKIIVDNLETHCEDFRNCENYQARVSVVKMWVYLLRYSSLGINYQVAMCCRWSIKSLFVRGKVKPPADTGAGVPFMTKLQCQSDLTWFDLNLEHSSLNIINSLLVKERLLQKFKDSSSISLQSSPFSG